MVVVDGQSASPIGIYIGRDYLAGDLVRIGMMSIRTRNGVLQTSTDRTTWSSLVTADQLAAAIASVSSGSGTGASSYLASLPPVAGGTAPIFAVDASLLTGSSGAAFATLTDLSGLGNSLAEPTAAQQPTLLTGAAGINGKNALRFNAGNSAAFRSSSMVKTGGIIVPAGLGNPSTVDFTMMCVARADGMVSANAHGIALYMGDTSTSNGAWMVLTRYGGAEQDILRIDDNQNGVEVDGTSGSSAVGVVAKMIYRWKASTKTLYFDLNGVSQGTQTFNGALTPWNTIAIGTTMHTAQYCPNMSWGEGVIWPGFASDSELTALRTYSNRWGS